MAKFERVVLSGTARERGIKHGERFAEAVATNVETYRERFSHEGVDVDAMREHAAEYVEYIEQESPVYAAEMRGIAEGSGVPLVDVTMLNVRWEVIYPAWKAQTEATDNEAETELSGKTTPDIDQGPIVDGCTSFGVMPSATTDGTTYMGQNWDWLTPIVDTLFLMELRREDAPDMLAMTEAGIVGGKIGMNEHGIGLAVNGLISGDDGIGKFRKPYHVRFREVLNAKRYDEALRPILETDRVCSANVLVGHADGELIDLEAAPELVAPIHPKEGILTHSNHFEIDSVESVNERRGPSTLYRAERLRRLLAEDTAATGASGEREIDSASIREALQDHFGQPSSICSHVDQSLPTIEQSQTNASLIIDLGDRRILGQRGPPCEGKYHEYAL